MRGENSTVRKSYSEKEKAGLENGLTERADFMATDLVNDASFNESSSPGTAAGGYSRQVKGKRTSKSASSKGYSFEVEGCKS